jgi:antitoxin component of MazEF toxin-antitoxin module
MGSDFKHRRHAKIGSAAGDAVDTTVERGAVLGKIPKRKRRSFALEQLIGGITEANRHNEIGWGPRVGGEAW